MELKDKIKKLRRGQYSQEELASLLGVSYVTVSRWENGTMTPTMKYMPKLAEALNTTSAYLLGETDDPAPSGQAVQQLTLPEAKTGEPVQTPSYKDFSTTTRGNLIYEFAGGGKLEIPNTPENAAMFWDIVKNDRKLIGLHPVGSM